LLCQDKLHGGSLRWWLRVEDPRYDRLHHAELWTLTKKMAGEGRHKLGFTIPLAEPLPGAFYLRLLSDTWLHVRTEGCCGYVVVEQGVQGVCCFAVNRALFVVVAPFSTCSSECLALPAHTLKAAVGSSNAGPGTLLNVGGSGASALRPHMVC
jgi:hypothetical protein